MKLVVLLFETTTGVLFLQLLLGGLLTFNFINATAHIIVGFVVFALAVATMIAALISKPAPRALKNMSILLVVLLVVQILLGFDTLRTGSSSIAWVHFVTALLIYGLAVSSSFEAIQWNRTSKAQIKNSPPTSAEIR